MKSKNKLFIGIIASLLFISILVDIGLAERPKTQANGEFTLGYKSGDYFEFYCTEMDATELNNVYGANWVTDLGSYFWFTGNTAPSNIGDKTRFRVDGIGNTTSYWQLQMDTWAWTAKTSTYGAYVYDDLGYTLPFNASSAIFNPTVWLLATPVIDYITGMSLPMGFTSFENEIYYNSTDVADYQIGWIFDEETGVVMNWWLKNGAGDTIYEMWGLELQLQFDESYNWIVTTFNQGQISNTFGPDWELDINTYCWWATDSPIVSGEKSMFYVDNVGNHPSIDDYYWFDIDGWNWKAKELLHGGVPDRDDGPYVLPMDPESFSFTPTLFIIPTPVERYLDAVSYGAGYTHDGNEVTLTTSDDEAYTVVWSFDEDLGVVDSFQIKNGAGTTIFHIILMEFKFDPGTAFEWEVTTIDETRLEEVLDTDWEANIQTYFGTGCNETGRKMKFATKEINLIMDLWEIDYDIWLWTSDPYTVAPNMTSGYSLFCNPEGGFWGSWIWIVPYLPEYYLAGRGYGGTTALNGLTVIQNATDVEDYQFIYTYDAILGVFNTVQLVDNENTVLFEYKLISAEAPPGGDAIPGFGTLFIIISGFLMIGLISAFSIRKRIKF